MQVWLEEEDDHNQKDKRRNKAQRTDTRRNLKRHIPLTKNLVVMFFFKFVLISFDDRCTVYTLYPALVMLQQLN